MGVLGDSSFLFLVFSFSFVLYIFSDNDHQDTRHNPVVILQPVDDGNTSPVKITLEGEPGVHLTAVNVVSNAKHMEIYDSRGEYLMTVRGQKEEDGQEILYRKTLTFESGLPACSLKVRQIMSLSMSTVFLN